jgi:hypothetical protein
MSDEIPDFTKLTPQQAHRITCADYLRMLAGLIENGAISAMELTWSDAFAKPTGNILTSALAFVAPLEAAMVQQVRKERERIQVEDLTEALKNHEPCPKDKQAECVFCSIRLS